MSFCRHYRALVRKNRINYLRTPFGSIAEVLFPVALMFILVYMRFKVETRVRNYDFLRYLWHPLYPISKPQEETGISVVKLYDALW